MTDFVRRFSLQEHKDKGLMELNLSQTLMEPYAALCVLDALKDRATPLSLDLSCNYFLIFDRPDLFTNAAVRVHSISHGMHAMLGTSSLLPTASDISLLNEENPFSMQSICLKKASDDWLKNVEDQKVALKGEQAKFLEADADEAKKKEAGAAIVLAEGKVKEAEGKLVAFQKAMRDYRLIWKLEKQSWEKERDQIKPASQMFQEMHTRAKLAEEQFDFFHEQVEEIDGTEEEIKKKEDPDMKSLRSLLGGFYTGRIQKSLEK